MKATSWREPNLFVYAGCILAAGLLMVRLGLSAFAPTTWAIYVLIAIARFTGMAHEERKR